MSCIHELIAKLFGLELACLFHPHRCVGFLFFVLNPPPLLLFLFLLFLFLFFLLLRLLSTQQQHLTYNPHSSHTRLISPTHLITCVTQTTDLTQHHNISSHYTSLSSHLATYFTIHLTYNITSHSSHAIDLTQHHNISHNTSYHVHDTQFISHNITTSHLTTHLSHLASHHLVQLSWLDHCVCCGTRSTQSLQKELRPASSTTHHTPLILYQTHHKYPVLLFLSCSSSAHDERRTAVLCFRFELISVGSRILFR